MVKKAKSSLKSTGTNRYSSPMIITGVVLVVVMIGGLIAAIFAYSNRGDNTSTEVIVEEVTDCPAEDGTQEKKLNFEKLITHEFDLSEINEAINLFKTGKAGRIIIKINEKE